MKKALIPVLILFICSCAQSQKETKAHSNITWETAPTNPQILSCESKSIQKEGLVAHFEAVLDKLNREKLFTSAQLLFYVDATNGYVFISGYVHETEEVMDGSGLWVGLSSLWEDSKYDAFYFDEMVIGSIEKALRTKAGKATKENHQVFIQTEIDEAVRVK